jgi:hypothetical protein
MCHKLILEPIMSPVSKGIHHLSSHNIIVTSYLHVTTLTNSVTAIRGTRILQTTYMNWHPCYDATRFAFLAPRLRTDAGANLWPPAGLAVGQLHCHHSHCLPQSWSPLMDQMQIQLKKEKIHLLIRIILVHHTSYNVDDLTAPSSAINPSEDGLFRPKHVKDLRS